jgi:hypothetical protein
MLGPHLSDSCNEELGALVACLPEQPAYRGYGHSIACCSPIVYVNSVINNAIFRQLKCHSARFAMSALL